MADLSFTSTPIIRDVYTDPTEALAASITLGCSGYRTYNLNGTTVYVPCASYVEYEKALRYNIVQGKVAARGSEVFPTNIIGYQTINNKNEIQGDPFFTLGNFNVSKSISLQSDNVINSPDQPKKITATTLATAAGINTVDNVSTATLIEQISQQLDSSFTVKINFDKRQLDKYVLFSSLKEGFKNSIIEIAKGFPAGIKIIPRSITTPSVYGFIDMPLDKRAQFTVSQNFIFNPFNIKFTEVDRISVDDTTITSLNNFAKTYTDFVIYYNGVEYPIIDVILPGDSSNTTNDIEITTDGRPFLDVVNSDGNANPGFYIKPSRAKYNEFFASLSDLAAFLLTYNDNDKTYRCDFTRPQYNDSGELELTTQSLQFPTYDDVNIDLFSNNYDVFLTTLNSISNDYDLFKTNLISRFLTTESLTEFDTPDKKMGIVFQSYGRVFDEVRKYIDGLAYMRNVSYDKIDNVPDLLLKNYAHTLGWETYEIEDHNTIIESLFNVSDQKLKNDITPAELDIELWRRLLINSFYLFKSKGTRKSIEFLLKLIGIPQYIIELNEFVYTANQKIDPVDTLNRIYNSDPSVIDPIKLIGIYPFDGDGFPTVPPNTPYQEDGGYLTLDDSNIGPYDFGNKYINEFKKFGSQPGFEINKLADNQKSWVYNETEHYLTNNSDLRFTNYYEKDSRLSINSKELDVYITSDKIIDYTVYNYFATNNINIDNNLDSVYKTLISPKTLTFNDYVKSVLNNYINIENRKTIITYPTLTKIYLDFSKLSGNYVNNSKSLEFLSNFDTLWIKLIKQFIPATTIVNAGNKIKNSIYNDNKFTYKHGVNNDVNWIGSDGSEFQQKALKPVYEGVINPIIHDATITKGIDAEPITYDISGKLSTKLIGTDNTINQYFGVHYSILDNCDETTIYYDWEANVDYAASSIGGNINETTSNTTLSLLYNVTTTKLRRYGVFVIYNNNLYRLNTARANLGNHFASAAIASVRTIKTDYVTGGTIAYTQEPNKSVLHYITGSTSQLDLNYNMYELIPRNSDSKSITFKDCNGTNNPAPNITEREFFINTIGKAFAYMDTGIQYICPPPQPHVCYFDYSGRTINLFNSVASSNINYTIPAIATYTDNSNKIRTIKQPRYYGYSKSNSINKPTNAVMGKTGNWVIPYNGTMYEGYSVRTKTNPLMHIETAYIDKVHINPNTKIQSFNLTKLLNLDYVFSGATTQQTYKVNDNIIGDNLYFSDDLTINFDGFYPIDNNKIGPYYTTNIDESLIQTLTETTLLAPDKSNFISIQSLNENFKTIGNDVSLSVATPGFYTVIKTSYLNFNFNLYFTSDSNTTQTVKIRLVDVNSSIYNEQIYTFIGNDIPDNRIINYQYEGFFKSGQRVYLVIEPVKTQCTLSRYEVINYIHEEPLKGSYDPTLDGRFRLMFNTGRKIFNGLELEEGMSIDPIFGKPDINSVLTTGYTVNEYLFNNQVNFKINGQTIPSIYYNIPRLSITQNNDPTLIFNKLYGPYYKKYTDNIITDEAAVAIYDKDISYDKINFSFQVRTKQNKSTSVPGTLGTNILTTITAKNYFLGNTNPLYAQGSVSKNILIGKNISKRNLYVNAGLSYLPNNSFKNGIALIGTGNTFNNQILMAYNDGLLDYNNINLNNEAASEITNNKRFIKDGITYQYENPVYTDDTYTQILNAVEYFDSNIINYQINDIVKVKITDYPMVVKSPTGTTIQTGVTIDRLYVCVEDIINGHCALSTNGTSTQRMFINTIYQPNGTHSCFVDITKYDPKNFTPWGYEKIPYYLVNSNNIEDYTYKKINQYSTVNSAIPVNLVFGDLVQTTNGSETPKIYKFIYPKEIPYYTGTTINGAQYTNNRTYLRGDYVYVLFAGSPDKYNFALALNANGTKLLPTTSDWRKYDSTSINNLSNPFNTGLTLMHTNVLYNFSRAKKIPNIVPSDSLGTPTGWTITSSNILGSNYKLPKSGLYTDISFGFENDGERPRVGYYFFSGTTMASINPIIYSGSTTGYTMGNSNIFKYSYKDNTYWHNSDVHLNYNEWYNCNPLFEELCDANKINNPQLFATGTTYTLTGTTGNYHSYKYAVSRGKLYKYIGTKSLTPGSSYTLPCNDTINWLDNDFCLSDNFTFYKDRTKVSVFESTPSVLTDDVKNNLFFYNSNLSLKNGFLVGSFSGSTLDTKLSNGLDKYTTALNTNTPHVFRYGSFAFRSQNSDIIMDYYVDKDVLGFPKTGEFIGKLSISDMCGNSASTIFGLLFDTDMSLISQLYPITPNTQTISQVVNNTPYNIRLITNQTNQSSVNVSWVTSDNISSDVKTVKTNNNLDTTINVNPNTDLTITFRYDTNKGQTIFDYAFYNTISLFDANGNGINNVDVTSTVTLPTESVNTLIQTTYNDSIFNSSTYEYRTVTIKNISANAIIRFGVKGITGANSNQTATTNIINI